MNCLRSRALPEFIIISSTSTIPGISWTLAVNEFKSNSVAFKLWISGFQIWFGKAQMPLIFQGQKLCLSVSHKSHMDLWNISIENISTTIEAWKALILASPVLSVNIVVSWNRREDMTTEIYLCAHGKFRTWQSPKHKYNGWLLWARSFIYLFFQLLGTLFSFVFSPLLRCPQRSSGPLNGVSIEHCGSWWLVLSGWLGTSVFSKELLEE